MLDEFYLQDIEDLTVELILNICSFQDSTCEIDCCDSLMRPVIGLIDYLVKVQLHLNLLWQEMMHLQMVS